MLKVTLSPQCGLPCSGREGQRPRRRERGDSGREQRRGLQSRAGDHAGKLVPLETFIISLSHWIEFIAFYS